MGHDGTKKLLDGWKEWTETVNRIHEEKRLERELAEQALD